MKIVSKRIRWIVDGVSVQEMGQLLRRREKKGVLVASMMILYVVAGQPGGQNKSERGTRQAFPLSVLTSLHQSQASDFHSSDGVFEQHLVVTRWKE